MKQIITIVIVAMFGFTFGCGGTPCQKTETPEAPDVEEVVEEDVAEEATEEAPAEEEPAEEAPAEEASAE